MAQTRDFWHILAQNKFTLQEGANLPELTTELVGYLGSIDPDLRDEVAYTTFAHWIGEGVYSTDQLRDLLQQMLANLQVGLGEVETDSVFGRSFAALILDCIIDYDNQVEFLSATEFQKVYQSTLDYLAGEKDLRGYVAEKGWAHSAAHTADTLGDLAQSRYCQSAELEGLLNAIGQKIMAQVDYVYRHDEDERLAMAMLALLRRELVSAATFQAWLDSFVSLLTERRFQPEWNGAVQNTKNFLRSLYLQLALGSQQTAYLGECHTALLAIIQKTDRYIR